MLNPAKLLKMAKSITSPDEALEVLSMMGVDVDYKDSVSHDAGEVEAAVVRTIGSEAKSFYTVGGTVRGVPVRAFVVVGLPKGNGVS